MTTSGESHGPAETCIVQGVPAGLCLGRFDDRSRPCAAAGRLRPRVGEWPLRAIVAVSSPECGMVSPWVRRSRGRREHRLRNWWTAMSPGPLPAGEPSLEDLRPVVVPRPGHADLGGIAKYGLNEARNVLERASARETVGRVAGGAVCRCSWSRLGVTVRARVVSIGAVLLRHNGRPVPIRNPSTGRPRRIRRSAAMTLRRARPCARPSTSARRQGESLGGVFEIWCWGLCPGLGGYGASKTRLDGRLLGALGCIPAIKGVEIGHGFENAHGPGSLRSTTSSRSRSDGRCA